ncbi:hypothetical protein [Ruminiclostridium josui]|uniref:hypothetical protein n=1 Tax=Ruminiclostridium josui TaxID=1499 RepID=UPI00046563C0|nr:hypothetical protein [Ruminiclostridium josui]
MDDSYSIANLEELGDMFKKLLIILEKEGDYEVKYAKTVLNKIVIDIENILLNTNTINLTEVFYGIIQDYKSLYPPKSGLTEFFIWRDDYNERVKANKNLDDLKNNIKKIIGV